MKFKLIIAMVDDHQTDTVLQAARKEGATGATVITSARGEGVKRHKTFLGLDLNGTRDVILLLVEGHLSRTMLERIAHDCQFDEAAGQGIALQIDIEDAVGLLSQIGTISEEIEEKI